MGVSIMHSNMYLAGYTYFNFLISFLLRWITFREYLAMISFCPSKIFSCWNSIFLNLKSGHDAGPIKQLVLLAGEPISKVLLHVRTEVEAKDWRCGTVSPSCFSRALYLLDMVVTFFRYFLLPIIQILISGKLIFLYNLVIRIYLWNLGIIIDDNKTALYNS